MLHQTTMLGNNTCKNTGKHKLNYVARRRMAPTMGTTKEEVAFKHTATRFLIQTWHNSGVKFPSGD